MINLKTLLVLLTVAAACHGDPLNQFYKKKHHHHHYGMHVHQFLYYLTFIAIKLKIMFFLGTIFTISLLAGKVIAIIKFAEYMKNKHPHHEEKIVFEDPHGYGGGYHGYGGDPGEYASPSEINVKTYPSYPPDFSLDHPPDGAYTNNDPYNSPAAGANPYHGAESRNFQTTEVYGQLILMANRLRRLNITDMALNEMGIKDEHCKKKFVCKAAYNARRNLILRAGLYVLRDVSYQKYRPNSTVTSEEECDSLHELCKAHT